MRALPPSRSEQQPDAGPSPLVRAGVGLMLGLAAGALAALLTPRPERARRPDPRE